jgi:glutamate dehydrogenase
LETLPDETELRRRAARGEALTSPEIATLTAHVKLALKVDLLASNLPDQQVFADRLLNYFPPQLRQRLPEAIAAHPLRREITSTVLANEVIDTAGMSYLFRLAEDTGATSTDAVRAFAAASAIAGIPLLLGRIRSASHDTKVLNDAPGRSVCWA